MERKTTERTIPYWCSTNSGHEHSTEWEAANCSELFTLLQQAMSCAEEGVMNDELFDLAYRPSVR